ncbi:MAG: AIR synthase-related protein, partial [Bacteroidia bacterium]
NTGGGQTKILHFIKEHRIIKDNLFATPPLFQMIQSQSGTDWQEMYKVFNMGSLLEFYTDEKTAESLIQIAKTFDIEAQIIGRVEPSAQKEVLVSHGDGIFSYP